MRRSLCSSGPGQIHDKRGDGRSGHLSLAACFFVLASALAFSSGCKDRRRAQPDPAEPPPQDSLVERIDAALLRGASYLRSVQKRDGSFRGELYAAFRGGRDLTPLAGLALRLGDAGDESAAAAERAALFVSSAGDAPLSYPVYDLAGAALLLNMYPQFVVAREGALAELLGYQLGPARGWDPEDLSFGGWSYASAPPDKPEGQTRRNPRLESNLSATVFALGALALSGKSADTEESLAMARDFVARCQNFEGGGDGGFFFSPTIADSNKAGESGGRFRSYGSSTADGLRALIRLGVPLSDPRIVAAKSWLLANYEAKQNPGAFPATHEVRRASSYYYYAWSSAHALRLVGETDWAPLLAEVLLERQRSDGSWANAAGEMREDEPTIATSFAVAALSIARLVLTAEYRSHQAKPATQPGD